jgi:Tol biopolymer transport system component
MFFLRERTLMARPFDAARLEFTGEPFPLTEGIAFAPDSANFAFTASEDGTLAYRIGAGGQWLWMDRSGKSGGSIRGRQSGFLRLSPDGKRVAFTVAAGARGNADLWMHDIERDARTRLTSDPAYDHWPVWSPDGLTLVFDSTRRGKEHSLYEIPSNGAAPERLLLEPEPGFGLGALDWSVDGRLLIFSKAQIDLPTTLASPGDLWVLPLSGDRKPFPYLTSPFDESEASLSPNGRWLAYTSNESGAYQVFVRPFPDAAGGKSQISTVGGLHPRWRRDGRELYYYEPGGPIVAVAVRTDRNFEVGASTPLFRPPWGRFALPAGAAYPYDVTPDGQRFLVMAPPDAMSSQPITVVLNWSSALRR